MSMATEKLRRIRVASNATQWAVELMRCLVDDCGVEPKINEAQQRLKAALDDVEHEIGLAEDREFLASHPTRPAA
jgi:hypothetical protein